MNRATRNAPLDSIRGLAAIGVFVFHASNRIGETYGAPYQLLGHFDVGVRVFFVLSGYFIYMPFVRAHLNRGRGVQLGEYAWKRFWRIYPAYWIALAFAVAIGYSSIEGWHGLAKHGLLVQNYFEDEGGTGLRESWTLVVEVTLYVLIPIYALLVRLIGRAFGRPRTELVGAIAILVAGLLLLPAYVDARGVFRDAGLGRVLEPAILAVGGGMLLAVLDSVAWSAESRSRLTRLARPTGYWWAAAGVVFAALVLWLADSFRSPSDHNATAPGWIHYQWGHALIATLLVAPLVLAPEGGGAIRRWLSHPWLVLVGVISFSFYLWHIRVLTFVLRAGGFSKGIAVALVVGLAALGASLVIGWVGQRWVEQPCARRASSVPRPLRESRSTQPSPTVHGGDPGR